ncbi:hypothetical protein [Chitinibacter tainanensis]|uniref:hypothetical protein n=1 Tax=Chitinibacter tainanensis TaxID=230667 RepID=UPI002352B6A0|nr:hypothetical protein [Chitinibacter tainanensis]
MKCRDFFSNYEFMPSMGDPRQLSIFICGLWGFEVTLDEEMIKETLEEKIASNSIDVINGDCYRGVFIFIDIDCDDFSKIKKIARLVFDELIALGAVAVFLTNELWVENVIYGNTADEGAYVLGFQIGDDYEYGEIVDDEVVFLNSSAIDRFFKTKSKLKLVQS